MSASCRERVANGYNVLPVIDYKLPILSLLGLADFERIVAWPLIAEHIDFVTHHSETLRINKQFCGLEG